MAIPYKYNAPDLDVPTFDTGALSSLNPKEATDPYAVQQKQALEANAARWKAKEEALRAARIEAPDKMQRIAQALLAFGAPTQGNNWAALSNAAKSLSMNNQAASDAEQERKNELAKLRVQQEDAAAAIKEKYGFAGAQAQQAVNLKRFDTPKTGYNPVTGVQEFMEGPNLGFPVRGDLKPASIGVPEVVIVDRAKFYRDQKGELKPLPKEQLSTEDLVNRASAVQDAKDQQKIITAAKTVLPTATNAVNQAIKDVNGLISHPGMSAVVGMPNPLRGGLGPVQIPGTPAAGFEARYKKVKGGSFLQAREALKGGGQITDFEGKKAEDAMAAMDKAQSEEEFTNALNDYKSAMTRGLVILANTARGNFTPLGQAPAAPAGSGSRVRSFNPKTGKIE